MFCPKRMFFWTLTAYQLMMFNDLVSSNNAVINSMKGNIQTLARQVMLQQLANEERVRSSGDSGLKMVRLGNLGSNPYLTATHSGQSVASIHDHSDTIRTVGMGEIIAVLNGVEFRTRHNDFLLYQPHETSSKLHAYQEIAFPEVPPEVKGTPQEQVAEMRLWFKAFKDQDHTVRDYRKYFKPVLCYLEGSWMVSTSDKIEEAVKSNRHHIAAKTWFELQEKIRYTGATGLKDIDENLAFLPTTISHIESDSTPKYAQWNYRIMCHPLKHDLPLNRFKLVDDLATRLIGKNSMPQQALLRSARFQINPKDQDVWSDEEFEYSTGLLDKLMYEIPGKDNYIANIKDNIEGTPAQTVHGNTLNAGYYHRKYQVSRRGAMGGTAFYRGYNDQNMFVAFTTQTNVLPLTYTTCESDECTNNTVRASYAIPLEIIYLTPLYKWNPYNITYRGNNGDPGTNVVDENRDGGPSKQNAFNGTHSESFYQTPMDFFIGGEVKRDAADTASDSVSVLDQDGSVRNVSASGTRITLPSIGNLGNIRLRYPVPPIHDEGSVTRKELEAVKKVLLELRDFNSMLREPLDLMRPRKPGDKVIKLQTSTFPNVKPHTHIIVLTADEFTKLKNDGDSIWKDTSFDAGHQHRINLSYSADKNGFIMDTCDDNDGKCWDSHPLEMYAVTQ